MEMVLYKTLVFFLVFVISLVFCLHFKKRKCEVNLKGPGTGIRNEIVRSLYDILEHILKLFVFAFSIRGGSKRVNGRRQLFIFMI